MAFLFRQLDPVARNAFNSGNGSSNGNASDKMASAAQVRTPYEAVARIAYLASDVVVSVQPSHAVDSEFSKTLKSLSASKAQSLVAKTDNAVPEILPVRHNADPLLSVFTPIRSGRLVSVTTSSSILLSSVAHLYKLANFPVVIHVSLHPEIHPDYSNITSIRNAGWTFLQSETLQEAQDMALTAHALAVRSGKGVIHFFSPAALAHDEPIAPESEKTIGLVLNLDNVRRFQAGTISGSGIYADDGRQVLASDQSEALQNGETPVASQLPSAVVTEAASKASSQASEKSSQKSTTSSPPTISSATTIEAQAPPVSSEDIYKYVTAIWAQLEKAVGRQYNVFEYSGPTDAENCLFVFGSDTGLFSKVVDEAPASTSEYAKLGIVTPRLYRPWLSSKLNEILPKSVKRIAVLEQVGRKTTKWGPILLDVLTSVKSGPVGVQHIVGYQVGYITAETADQALRGIVQNLVQEKPIQNLQVGAQQGPQEAEIHTLEKPKLETAYSKILDQLYGKRVYIANELESENAGISATISASPEFGFGSLLARKERRQQFLTEAKQAASSGSFAVEAKEALSKWSVGADDVKKSEELADDVINNLEKDSSDAAQKLLQRKEFFRKQSLWLVGSDAWAYDLGNSGVHHVLASGENVNMLIIDSTPYSERAAADANRRKKDIGLYAMNFGNAYVASVAVYSSYTQVLQAFDEADKFNGPSIILAYLPYYGEHDSALTVLQETKKAVDVGYWPLYRWNPANEKKGEPNFALDSELIKKELKEFLARDNQLTQMMQRDPTFGANLAEDYGTEVRAQQKRKAKDAYNQLLEGLLGAPLTILTASDNGNATNLGKRLANRGRQRGLKTTHMAMEDYPVEDLPSEENIVFITSTAGQGEFPQNGIPFWDAVKDSTELDLAGVKFSVMALGDSHYWPRKEDKVYYNKPGKDLDRKLASFGAERLADIGLGDDQDPDGFQTGYQEWEPKIWEALGVDKVEGLPEEPPPRTNEDIKIESNYLRGTIVEGLNDPTTGAISADDGQLTKFHGTYMQDDRDVRDERKAQGLEPAYSFMIRCRLPGGISTPQQWIQMDDIANTLGNETMKLTTRQTFQFHGVIKSKLKPAMQAINRALMTTIAACGDVNRNVMSSSLPANNAYQKEVWQCSKLISDHLLPATSAYHEIWLTDDNDKKTQVAGDAVQDFEPLYGPTYLPRKFKITIAIPPHNDTDVYAHDIGLIAIKGEDGKLAGFNVLAGGGMGATHNNKKTYPQTGRMMGYVPADKVHIACEKIMLVQRDNGDRKNRKHARLKYTIDDMGVDVFRSKVEEYYGEGFKFEEARPFHFDSNVDTFGWVRDELGLNHFTFFIENGRIEDTPTFQMKTGLREIAKVHTGEFRLTGNQHLILSNVEDKDVEGLKTLMAKYKLDNIAFSGLRLSSSACVAFPTCGLAMAESERYLPVLISKLEACLEENGLRQDSIVMRMTGCPNGCARPWLAEVAFVGKAFGAYNMYLGGGYHGQRLNKLYRSSIKEEEILMIMRGLLKRYAAEKDAGEHFGDWCIRAGVIVATREGQDFHDDVAEEDEDEE